MPENEKDIIVGRIASAHGIRGEVKMIMLTEFPERFNAGKDINVKLKDESLRSLHIENSKPYKDGIVLKLQGIDTRNDAELLTKADVIISEDELGDLPEEQFFLFDIIGLKVVTDDGREQGEVTEVLQGSANDVYITSTGLCIPALKDVVAKIDLENGLLVIRPVPGLLAED